jgi:lipooligosaccharide transport system ATP-binding protein
MALLEARGLCKSYGETRVVDALDLDLDAGSILGLLGPNGAGKTTTLRMLYGLIEPEQGAIRCDGLDFGQHRKTVKRWLGVCTQDDTLDYDFTVRQNLRVYANYFRPKVGDLDARLDRLLELFELTPYAAMSPYALSGGFKRRLMLARSVVHAPRILFLDEPTTGLDPKARVDVWEMIDRLRSEGMALILTTHYMDEAERLSDRLLVMSRGAAIARGTPRGILGELLGEHVVVLRVEAEVRERVARWLAERGGGRPASILGELHVPLTAPELAAFTTDFTELRFTVRPPTLDDLFIKLSVVD